MNSGSFRETLDIPHLYGDRKASLKLNILVIGCGLGGLAAAHCLSQAGHDVIVFEAAQKLGEIGAGIQLSPNVSKLLIRWGLSEQLKSYAVQPESIVFRKYNNGEIVGSSKWGEVIVREHGAPYYHIHRADLHRIMLDLVLASPRVTVRLNARVESVQPNPSPGPSVKLVSGEVIEGDLIIGADGVHSLTRQAVCGLADFAQPTGDAAYRAIIPTDLMIRDPQLKSLVNTPNMTTWMGPNRHLMAYCIRAKKEFNLVMVQPDDWAVESWTAEGDVEKLRADFADFEPRVRKLLSLVQTTLRWRLVEREPLKSWVHPEGRAILLGDACHPMLPYRAQGAAMSIEDAAVLGNLLSRLSSLSDLPHFLHAYERLRQARTSSTQETSRLNKYVFHLADGPEQAARDASMRRAQLVESARLALQDVSHAGAVAGGGEIRVRGGANEENANQWADRRKNEVQYGYDADVAAERWWEEEGEAMVCGLDGASSPVSGGSVESEKKSFWSRITGRRCVS